ncbi:MAG: gumH [Geminicoccaceae bacterium]|nr:gumH [Geminicoccaceae bacterium]
MRILEAVADGVPGGGTAHVLQLIAAVRAHLPVEVHLVSQAGSPALAEARRLGAIVHGLDFFSSRFDPRLWLGLGALVRRLRPTLIHAHGARAGLPLAAIAGRRVIYSVHGYHFVGKGWPARQLAIMAERRCSRRAGLTLFVCASDRELAAAAGILRHCRRERTIPNGIELDLPPATGSPDGRCLGFLGRLVEQKNPLLLLDVLDALRGEGFRLAIIGDGPLAEEMRQRAAALALSERVEFTGSLPRAQALERLRAVDVLLMPSLWEGMPLAALEAMAMGVPVVASAVGGLKEIIEDGRSGFLVEGRDPGPYAAAIRRLIADPAERAGLVARAREVVAERFAWTAAQEAYLDLYRAALASA